MEVRQKFLCDGRGSVSWEQGLRPASQGAVWELGGLWCAEAGMKGDKTLWHKENLPEVQAVKPCSLGIVGNWDGPGLSKTEATSLMLISWFGGLSAWQRAARPLIYAAGLELGVRQTGLSSSIVSYPLLTLYKLLNRPRLLGCNSDTDASLLSLSVRIRWVRACETLSTLLGTQ